jgi:hypothetical protein
MIPYEIKCKLYFLLQVVNMIVDNTHGYYINKHLYKLVMKLRRGLIETKREKCIGSVEDLHLRSS